MTKLDDLISDYLRICEAESYECAEDVAAARSELAALRERCGDLEIVFRGHRCWRDKFDHPFVARDANGWFFKSIEPYQVLALEELDGLPVLTPEARAALRKEVGR